jgi:tetratricopeptide (TPR) repeat protein
MADNPRIEELRRRVLADPASIAFAALAEEYRRVGNYAGAIETCRMGLQRHPSYLSARVTLGRALMETAQYDEARRELELVLKSAPENLAAIRGLAEIHERQAYLPELETFHSMPGAPHEPLVISSTPAAGAATAAAVVEKPIAEPRVEVPAADPAPVRAAVPIAVRPVAVAVPDPAVARLEQLLVAIKSARVSSGTSR